MEDVPWALIIPIALIQLALAVIALLDLAQRRETNGPKLAWVLAIIIFGLIGPVLYLTLGRKEDWRTWVSGRDQMSVGVTSRVLAGERRGLGHRA